MNERQRKYWSEDFTQRATAIAAVAKRLGELTGSTHAVLPVVSYSKGTGTTYRVYGLPRSGDIIQSLDLSLVIKKVNAEDNNVTNEVYNLTGDMLDMGDEVAIDLHDVSHYAPFDSHMMRLGALDTMAQYFQDMVAQLEADGINNLKVE